uniref:Uncharacterized protein n=1 Tax=Oryza brachyantha TaxID=4533 RepID=J3NEF5_ORYBR
MTGWALGRIRPNISPEGIWGYTARRRWPAQASAAQRWRAKAGGEPLVVTLNCLECRDIGERAFVRAGRLLASAFMYAELYLVEIGFHIIDGDNLEKLFPGSSVSLRPVSLAGKQLLVVQFALVVALTSWLSSIGVLAHADVPLPSTLSLADPSYTCPPAKNVSTFLSTCGLLTPEATANETGMHLWFLTDHRPAGFDLPPSSRDDNDVDVWGRSTTAVGTAPCCPSAQVRQCRVVQVVVPDVGVQDAAGPQLDQVVRSDQLQHLRRVAAESGAGELDGAPGLAAAEATGWRGRRCGAELDGATKFQL